MKKYLIALLVMFGLLVSAPIMAANELPTDNLYEMFGSFALLAAGIPFIVEIVKGIFKPGAKLVQYVSWIAGILVTLFGWYFNLGFLDGLLWWQALITGLFASLSANGLYDTNFYTWLLKILGIIKV